MNPYAPSGAVPIIIHGCRAHLDEPSAGFTVIHVEPQSILRTMRSSKDPLSPLFLAFSSMRSLSE